MPHQPLRDGPAHTGGPSLTGRAFLALAFLLGFYVLAGAVIGALVAANVALYAFAGRASGQLVIVTLVIVAALVRGVFFIARSDDTDLPGVPVDEHSQPELVELVHSVARDMGTAPPARILLVPEVNAAVTQTGGLLGFRPGERVMVLGVPLIHALSVDQLRGVVAHEIGHYAGGDTRLGALTYRAGASIYRTVENLGDHTFLGRLFSAYGRRYLILSLRVRRQQELSADAAAVRLAGRDSHISALRRVEVTAFAFDHFVRFYLAPLWQKGYDAENAFEGYRALLADPAREAELAELEAAADEGVADRFDSHPSLAERVVHAGRLPEGASAEQDSRPAGLLLQNTDDVERDVSRLLTRQVTGRQMDEVVRWDHTAAEVFAADLREDSDVLLRAAATVVGKPEAASLAWAFALVEDGRAEELAAVLTGPVEDATAEERAELHSRALRHYMASAIGSYLTTERGHSWAISWSGPIGLVDGKGKLKDPFAMAGSLLDDPASGGRLRRSLGGVTPLNAFRASPASMAEPPPAEPEVVHVVPEVQGRRRYFDLILSTSAVILHPMAGGVSHFVHRMMTSQGVSGPAAKAAQARLEKLFSLPSEELLGKAPGAVVLPLDAVTKVRKRRGWAVELAVAGDPKPWRLRCRSKQARAVLLGAIQEQLAAQVSSTYRAAG
ncbi:MAG TPA: M48 family metallopeptidase [Acidimicrobiales bacterium]|nr:M48 family metallopeptidase [Acidimicrobiales bacterium]